MSPRTCFGVSIIIKMPNNFFANQYKKTSEQISKKSSTPSTCIKPVILWQMSTQCIQVRTVGLSIKNDWERKCSCPSVNDNNADEHKPGLSVNWMQWIICKEHLCTWAHTLHFLKEGPWPWCVDSWGRGHCGLREPKVHTHIGKLLHSVCGRNKF